MVDWSNCLYCFVSVYPKEKTEMSVQKYCINLEELFILFQNIHTKPFFFFGLYDSSGEHRALETVVGLTNAQMCSSQSSCIDL